MGHIYLTKLNYDRWSFKLLRALPQQKCAQVTICARVASIVIQEKNLEPGVEKLG